ncbi:type II toxin-antitoxin system VapC family toxin [Thiorhodovibrio frisius]|uniref:Ribonuclease VapC n=1 Tax=Thiorhodovibrio frisius TaxID=631362 RepID=H8Z6Y2_9GAMM|nr:type II toxin-antitoxin system VapC family toxin [Thiorhodovibrio frisius]EIC19767.1 putative nucleic acid-binding protein [Thiorhodovibrio frisius]WPL20263.1 tRNA(fMet)-specific endonuclease VapC [Thiorhodovibrio frisius]
MKPALLDTDVLSLYLKAGDKAVVQHGRQYISDHGSLNFSIITYYEIVSGLRHRDARKQLQSFFAFVARNRLLPMTRRSADLAAEHYARLRLLGTPLDDIDLLIAGIALEHGLVLVTRNRNHFDRIDGLLIDDWSNPQPLEQPEA